jgi:NAD+ kinase
MAFPVRTCALVGRFSDARVAESVGALLPYLAAASVTVLVSDDAQLTSSSVTRVPEAQFGPRADLVIAVGGDGTLLYAARSVARPRRAAARVNRGRAESPTSCPGHAHRVDPRSRGPRATSARCLRRT